jgi:hypothetical protein
VTDQSSLAPHFCRRIRRARPSASTRPAATESPMLRSSQFQSFHRLACSVCGRWGQLVEVFRRR